MRKHFSYAIKVEKEEVWHGLNPKKKFDEIKKKNPGKKVSICWRTKEDVLVCLTLSVALADSNAVPSIFGRVDGLDKFNVSFLKGEKTKFVF